MQRTVLRPILFAALLCAALLAACSTGPAAQTAAPAPSGETASPATTAAEGAAPLGYLDRLPPLIDRELFFGDPEISGGQLSPDGAYLTFLKPYEGVRNIWIKALDAPFETARPLSADERPVPGYFWSEDGDYVLYVQDKGGNEDFHIYAVDPTAEAGEETGVPPARDLTPLEGVRAYIYAVPEATPDEILIGLNDRDPALHDVYWLNLETGERELLIENDQNVAGWVADLEGRVRLAVRETPDGGTEILRVEDGALGDAIYTCGFEETCNPLQFDKDGRHAFLLSNRGEDVDLAGLYRMDSETGETELIETDPEGEVDLSGAVFSDATDELLATTYVGDRVRIYPKTERFADAIEFLRSELPDGDLSFDGFTNDDRYAKVQIASDVIPDRIFLFDWQEMTVQKLYDLRPELADADLAPMEPIRYTARDGLEIPAYLTVPPGVEAKDLAVIVLPHGGPWSRDAWRFDPFAQFFANRGYAVLQPNFRGSTGYGKAFLNAGNKEWGTGAMQHDISDGVRYLLEQGIADPEKVCIFGGSYGGYATLAGVTFTPDLYTCGLSYVGPSNIITLINSIPPYWGPFKKFFLLRVGDPDDPQDREMLEAQSPFFHAERITAPLLVVQGANDPRVKKPESDQIVVKLRDLGREVEYLVAPDEGHGFRGRENRLAFSVAAERFFAQHLGGRVQDEVAPDIAGRLEALTVDVASVEMPKLASGLDAAKTAPLPAVDAARLALGTASYVSKFPVQGREMELTARRTVEQGEEDGESILRITDAVEGPAAGQDSYVLEADSLRPVSRRAEQGPATIEIEYGAREVTGTFSMSGQESPIQVELEAPVFGDSAALDTAISALPLAEGYRTTVRSVEIGMQQRVRFWSVAVGAAESVAVPAGSFETLRVAVEPLDGESGGQTLWVSREAPHRIVKAESELPPEMGGGTATTELVSVEP